MPDKENKGEKHATVNSEEDLKFKNTIVELGNGKSVIEIVNRDGVKFQEVVATDDVPDIVSLFSSIHVNPRGDGQYYPQGTLRSGGTQYVHTAVALKHYREEYLDALRRAEQEGTRPEVDHQDHDTFNTTPENLKWVTRGENMQNLRDRSKPPGSQHATPHFSTVFDENGMFIVNVHSNHIKLPTKKWDITQDKWDTPRTVLSVVHALHSGWPVQQVQEKLTEMGFTEKNGLPPNYIESVIELAKKEIPGFVPPEE